MRGDSLPAFARPSPAVSARMRLVRSRGTGLEAAMEELLRSLGIRFQRQPALPGHPDFLIRGIQVIVFCDSSFWHGRRERDRSGLAFGRNRAFWKAKLQKNRLRDQRTNRSLRRAGWSVLRFWDTDILKKPEIVKRKMERFIYAAH